MLSTNGAPLNKGAPILFGGVSRHSCYAFPATLCKTGRVLALHSGKAIEYINATSVRRKSGQWGAQPSLAVK